MNLPMLRVLCPLVLCLPAAAQVGTSYCVARPNSTGLTASLAGSGSAVVSANNLVLTCSNLPPSAAAYFLCSRSHAFIALPSGSSGNLCLGSPIGRRVGGLVSSSGATGVVNALVDVTAMPQPNSSVAVLPGETWSFQCWYRDSLLGGTASTSNFSDGLDVLFTGAVSQAPQMVSIPPGTFLMGSNAPAGPPYVGELTPDPVRQVTISYPFWMGRYEVTQAEFRAAVSSLHHPWFIGDTRPAEFLSWEDARAYCAALNSQLAATIPTGYEYRLPTEAEWEYACRAGTTTEFNTGTALLCTDASVASSYHGAAGCLGNSSETTPVGSYPPNAFGLYDMHGNVSEHCLDSYAPLSSAAVTDPFVTGGATRVIRGGGASSDAVYARSAIRFDANPSTDVFLAGFRLVLGPILVP